MERLKFRNKKVAVFGMARSGISAIKLLLREKANITAVNRGEPKSWKLYDEISTLVGPTNCVSEECSREIFSRQDFIILSPGIPREHEVLKEALISGVPIISEIELGYNFLTDEKLISVTGSNGKTTTVSLMEEMIKRSKRSVFLGGNIGIPLCDYIISDQKVEFIVLELSSFQLESIINFKSDVAVILNLFLNHGERYLGIKDYGRAKFNITNNMGERDLLITPSNFKLLKEFSDKQICLKTQIDTDKVDLIKKEIEKRYSLKQMKIVGVHNVVNLYFALEALSYFEIDGDGIQQAIDTFEGVAHRVQYVKSDDLFCAYNDAKSTNFDALKTALNSLSELRKEIYVIVGGKRRTDTDSILPLLDNLGVVNKVLLIGETTEQFSKELEGLVDYKKCFDLKIAVKYARDKNFSGVLLLSPGFPSYDQYENFEKRGEHFISLIKK